MDYDTSASRSQTLFMVLLVEGGAGVVAVLCSWLFSRQTLGDLHVGSREIIIGIVGTGPMLVLFGVVYALREMGPMRRIDEIFRQLLIPMLAPCTIVDLIFISALAGVGEELLFRGLIQAVLADWFGNLAGLVLASLAFGFAHLITPTYGVLTTIAGAYLGLLYMLTGSLVPAMITHGLYDAFALIFVVKLYPPPDLEEPENDEMQVAGNDAVD